MTWEHCNIRRSGCVGSLVFLEVGRRCQGGPGILWMYCPNHLATQFRESLHKFIHDSAKSCNFPIQLESISVDASLNSTYNTRQQLNLPPLENHGIQSPLAAKQQSNLKSNNENSFDSDHAVQDNGNFRQRTSVMSSAEGKRYKSIRCKTKNDNNTPPITSPNCDQHSCTVEITTTSSRGNHSDKPPPLPPKPVGSTKSNEDSSGFSRSVYECSKHNKSSSLLKDKVSVQPTASPLRRQQIRTTAKERYQVETAAFQACSRIITDKLDVLIILPELNSHHLLTQKDQQFLNNKTHEDYDKIQYLLCCLPRKANGWFKKFLDCLHLTSASTGHGDIADSLSEKLRMLETQNGDDTALVSKPIQVSSMHDEDVRQPYTVFVDSPDTVKMLQVQSSESIRSLANKVRKEFCISPLKQLKLQVDDTHLDDSTQSSSLFDSRINRYSYITVTVLDDIVS